MWHYFFCFWLFVIEPAAICNWSSWKLSPWRGSCGSNPDHQPTRLWQVNTHGLLVREDREHVCLTDVWLLIIFTKATLYSSNSVGTDQHCQGLKAYSRVPLKLIPLRPPLYVYLEYGGIHDWRQPWASTTLPGLHFAHMYVCLWPPTENLIERI